MRIKPIAAVAGLLLALTACSSSEEPTAEQAPASTTASPEVKFLSDVKAANFESWAAGSGPTEADLTTYATDWCAELKAGHGANYILGDDTLYPNGPGWGTKKEEAQELVVLAVTAYCPEYRDQVTQELRDTGTY